jgi:DNA polymerase III subunit delta
MIIKSYEVNKKDKIISNNNFYLLYGENVGLKKDIRDLIINTKNEKAEYVTFYENDILSDEENFYNSFYSGSLFSNKKIITINNCSDKITKHIENIFDKNLEDVLLIIYSDILQKKSKLRNLFEKSKKAICIACYLDNERDLQNIMINELNKSKINLSREIINLVVEKSNYDRNNLKNEIEKIKSYSHNQNKINLEDIKYLINFSGEYKSDILVNECLSGNIFQYKKVLYEFYSNTINQIYLLRILSNKVHRLLNIKKEENDYSNMDSLLNSAKPPIFWKDKEIVKKHLKIWKRNRLKKVISEINETELLCKKYPQVSKMIFVSLFTKLCKEANSYS